MRRSTYFFYLIGFFLFLFGAVLAYIENASELSIWFIAFSIMLDISLLLLPIFGSAFLKLDLKHRPLMVWGLVALIIAILLVIASIPLRFLSFNNLFHAFLILSIVLWAISMVIFTRHSHR